MIMQRFTDKSYEDLVKWVKDIQNPKSANSTVLLEEIASGRYAFVPVSEALIARDALSVIESFDCLPKDLNKSDYRMAVALANGLSSLPAHVSVDWRFWSSMAFGPCQSYMKVRWAVGTKASEKSLSHESDEEVDEVKSGKGALITRWVGGGKGMTSLVRHGVARLWWIAKVADFAASESVEGHEKLGRDHYLRILFANQNIQWSIVLRRYGAMPRLVKACLDFIFDHYLEKTDGTGSPYKLKKIPGAINEIKECCRLLNVAAGGSMYDLKTYEQMIEELEKLRFDAKESLK
jgi:hypothetical protein